MNIAVDATCWQNKRGYGRYARALLRALVKLDASNCYYFFMDALNDIDDLPVGVEVVQVDTSSPAAVAASADGSRSFRDMWRVSRRISAVNSDLVLFPTIYTYVPVVSRAKILVVIHDVIPETYPNLTFSNPKSQLFWRLKSKVGRMQADAIITVSEYSRRLISSTFNIYPDQVYVVGEASDPVFRRIDHPVLPTALVERGLAPGDRWIIYVGGFGPHKNIKVLVDVFSNLIKQPEFSSLKLVLVGEYQREVFFSSIGEVINRSKTLGIMDRIVFTGFVSDEELANILNLSTVLVLPSLMEGFGLPAVEAAACGCPVIATNHSAMPDILGENSIFFNPENSGELEQALQLVLSSEELQQSMSRGGLEATTCLDWETSAKQMMQVMDRVAA